MRAPRKRTDTIFSLLNGGTAGTIWMTLIASLGMLTSTLSMAEMASISPTSGGQYHWVSEFAPPKLQKPLSYAVGWMAALGWQTAMPAVAYTAAIQVIALIATVDADYVIQGWHGALLTIAFVTFAILFNMFAINKLPLIEGLVVIIHLFGFFAFVVVLWVTGPRTPGSVTFTTFADEYGWGSPGLAMLVSIVGPAAALIGADAAVHLAEELQDASYVLPHAMITSALINYATAFVAVISLVSAIGPNLEEVLATTTGQPWVEIVRLATGSQTATIVLVVLVCFQYTFTSINQVTTSSRQLWALARDKGIPFHRFLSKVDSRNNVPQNAVIITLCTTIIVSLIIIGSSIAFNIILSICNVSLIASYLICIATFLAKRIRSKGDLPARKFSLGRFGLPLNIAALAWLSLLLVFLLFPAAPHPEPAGMNWACLMFGVVILFAFGWYAVRARHEYDGPMEYMRKDM
nr:hypothetical protein B0A51_14967 [Rachicladosporium sp. CCFEE 5018]